MIAPLKIARVSENVGMSKESVEKMTEWLMKKVKALYSSI